MAEKQRKPSWLNGGKNGDTGDKADLVRALGGRDDVKYPVFFNHQRLRFMLLPSTWVASLTDDVSKGTCLLGSGSEALGSKR